MQQPHNDNKPFDVRDIERYYSGQMSAHEMHLLEKAALEDPFLADALEGYAFTKTPVEDVAYLQQKLEEKKEQKVVPIAWRSKSIFKIAAIFIVMGISAALIYRMLEVSPKDIAKTETTIEKNAVAKDTVALQPKNDSAYTSPVTSEKPFENVTVKTKIASKPSNKINRPVAARPKEQALAYQKAIADQEEQQQLEKMQLETEKQTMLKARTMAAPPPALDGKVAGISVDKQFKGKVVDTNNKPVPFAIVSVKGTNKATQADSNGNFTISSTEDTLKVAVNSVGFEGYNGILKSGDTDNTIALYPSTQSLSEVVVTGLGMKSDYEKEPPPPVVQLKNAKTVNQGDSFEDYIEGALNELKASGFAQKGKVKLEYDLDQNGHPRNIIVEKENCTPCVEKAKQLLEESPALKKKNSRKKVKTTIYF